jgi:hypothetical protein
MTTMPFEKPSPSLPVLLRDLRDESSTLIRQELALAQAELKENASRMAGHAGQIAAGGAVAYAGAIVLLLGLGHLLGNLLAHAGMDPAVADWAGPAILGLLVAVVGWAMLAKAKTAFAADRLAPQQTLETLQENKQSLKHLAHPTS